MNELTQENLIANLHSLQYEIDTIAKSCGRAPHTISFVAVSKQKSPDLIREAFACGINAFAENYANEAETKIKTLNDLAIEWHFIGPVQSNKTRFISENFAWVQSVDREKIAKRLNDQRPLSLPPLNVLLQVNIDHIPTQTGLHAEKVLEFSQVIQTLPRLKLRGLMAIISERSDRERQRHSFTKVQQLFDALNRQGLNIDTLSMGMSNDFPAAIQSGATLLRIGSRLLGSRD